MTEDRFLPVSDLEGMEERDESSSYFKSNRIDRSYHYIPGNGLTRYNTALKNLIPIRRKRKNNSNLGIDEAGLWQFITYNWMTRYMKKAYKNGLTVDDIPNPCPQDSCEYNTQRLEALWQDELIKKGPQSASLTCVTWRFMKTRVIVSSILIILCVILGFLSVAFFMRYLLEYAESNEGSVWIGMKWALLFTFTELIRNTLYAIAWTTNYRTAIRLRAGCLGMLYRKIMRVHHFGDKSIGELINIFSNDGQRIYDLVLFGPMITAGPVSMLLGIGYVYWIFGPWPVLGLCSMLIFYPTQYLLSQLSGIFKRKVFSLTDERLTVISEILHSIKLIKFYSWSKIYINKISEIRKKELSFLHKVSYCNSLASSLSTNAPVIAAILTFLIHIIVAESITASQAFSIIALYFNTLRNALHFIREGFRSIVDFNLALQRSKAFTVFTLYFKLLRGVLLFTRDGFRSLIDYSLTLPRFKAFPVISLLFVIIRLYATYLQYGLSNIIDLKVTCSRLKLLGDVLMQKESSSTLCCDCFNPSEGIFKPETEKGTDSEKRENKTPSVMLLNEHTTLLSRPVDKSQSVCIADGFFAYYINRDPNSTMNFKRRKSSAIQKTSETDKGNENETDLLNQVNHEHFLNANYKEILYGINFFAPKGSLIGVCGPVGSGKSSLLAGILGHLYMTKGKLCREGACAYVSQQPWLVNATLRENILFGEKFIARKYYDVIQSCDLGIDIDSLPGGDNTEIGERGVNLSGGQKQRISLARALYSDRDIYLLDDPLSAVDSEVSNHIFEKAILKSLHSKTVIFISHRVQLLNQCDELVIMKEGRIVERGAPSDLTSRESEYKLIMESFSKNDVTDSGEEAEESKSVSKKCKRNSPVKEKQKLKTPSKQNGLLIKEEKKEQGDIRFSTVLSYINACGGWIFFFSLIFVMLLNIGSSAFSSWWLHMWINAGSGNTTFMNADNTTVISNRFIDNPEYTLYKNIYFITIAVILVTNFIRGAVFTKVTLKASAKFHNFLMDKLMKTYLSFFETTPVGRIQNLFAKDMDEVENKLPATLESFMQGMINAAFSILFVCLAFPLFVVPMTLIIIGYFFVHRTFRAGLRELKRLDNLTRSPVFSNVSTTVEGLDTIHAFGKEQGFIQRFTSSFDINSVCFYMCSIANRWIALRVDAVAVFIIFVTSIFVIMMRGTVSASLAGLAIAYATTLSGMLQFTLRLITDIEVKFISVERINSYIHILKEEGGHGPKGIPAETWPELGTIRFRNVELKYKDEAEPVLKGISFHIRSEEKIGIVGRTGAGKSSIVTALFRLVEVSNGSIIIDDLDIANLNLNELRRRLSIIPQDPVLFAGTIRSNLDPTNQFTDEEIWSVLEKTSLKERVMMTEDRLHTKVEYNGNNLSTGEKQLLCLARALLKKSKILVLDEATSGLDYETEKIIQKTLFVEMKHYTIIIIAHRLQTVQSCHRILVMDCGKMAEFDEPTTLLNNSDSMFYRMMAASKHSEI